MTEITLTWNLMIVESRHRSPLILVGDSLGMVVLGYESTIPVTMDEMLHHTKAVVRGTEQALIIGDMPFMTYHASVSEALHNAARFIQEAGAQAVKLEGGETMAETVRRVVECGIPVMGHIGLTPQSVHQLGGFKVQGKTQEAAIRLVKDARALDVAEQAYKLSPDNPATLHYHRLHVDQLTVMHQISGDEVIREYRDRWHGYLINRWNPLRTLPKKLYWRLFYSAPVSP